MPTDGSVVRLHHSGRLRHWCETRHPIG